MIKLSKLLNDAVGRHKIGKAGVKAALSQPSGRRFMWAYVTNNGKFSGKAYRLGKTMTSPIELNIHNKQTGKTETKVFDSEKEAFNAWLNVKKLNK